MPARVYICKSSGIGALKKLLEYDPYLDKNLSEEELKKIKESEEANAIFARQDYLIKEARSLGIDSDDYYVYIKASDEFFAKAEKRLKESVNGIERVNGELEKKIIASIEEEQSKAEQGFGSIFG